MKIEEAYHGAYGSRSSDQICALGKSFSENLYTDACQGDR
jgi:hypothetical protein